MPTSNAFSLAGATPTAQPSQYGNLFGNSSASKALNMAVSPALASQIQKSSSGILSSLGKALTPNASTPPLTGSGSLGNSGSLLSGFQNQQSYPGLINSSVATPPVPATPSTALKSTKATNVDGSTVEHTYHAPVVPETGSSTSGSTPVDNSKAIADTTSKIADLEKQQSAATGAGYGASDQIQYDESGNPITKEPVPAPNASTPTFSGLVGQAETDYQKAAALSRSVGQAESDAEHNPRYALNVGIGRAGQIQSNAGLAAQEALTSAQGEESLAGKVAPTVGAYGQTQYFPLAAGQNGSGEVQPTDPFYSTLQQYAQAYASGQANTIPSSITGNAVLNAQALKMAKDINPSFNANVAGAQGSSAADLTTQASQLQSQANGAEANFSLLANIAKQGGVNDGNVPILNTIQQNVARGLASNEAVVNFKSILQSVRDQYASILGGGTVTDAGRAEALQLIPDDISLSALQSIGQNLKSDAGNRIAGIQNQVKNLTSGGGSSTSSSANSSGSALSWDNI